MLKKLFFLFLVFFSPLEIISSIEFIDKSGENTLLEDCQENDLVHCKEIFVQAFLKAYEELTPEQLGVEDKFLFLQDAFSDVYDDVHQGLQKIVVARQNGTIMGFVGFKKTEKPHQIYISQLAVLPQYWQRGLGTQLVFSALRLYDDVESLVVIPRKINHIAKQFYTKLGFVESSYMHPGYNPERYVGYEWVK